ncbi:bifunctional ADP-dependent NAD(P)H-hydrate dehydratase/NAD(P)H-hydrate epimerase [Alkalilimnicola ehrlichii]|uniref:NAD(P)H-hydrate dehydratase n=1 Tax=Alkalilimnicola ehrlichii TaxID=351052 RepID=UPI000E2EC73A|nr:NAD(P)H-hydrate dehydratase [Alkalilimnicola ehrlichii]RFA30460.1 bifunctional ADP-dependent NAD(P)H-hydrate dehydratase/NAD(P)H-hydrate epimerase [Alkalilimnicola ehrlichii]
MRLEHILYSREQLRRLDRLAATTTEVGSSLALMERAGAAAYRCLRLRWPAARRLCVVAGIGNNAGDGYVVARLAQADGIDVTVLQLGDATRFQGDALTVFERYRANGGLVVEFDPERLTSSELIVDALFGIGLDRPVTGAWLQAVRAVNAAKAPVLALDIPSGVQADTGAVLGGVVKATATVTFIGLKKGLYTGAGSACAGDIVFASLGVPESVYSQVPIAGRLLDAAECRARLAPRPRDAHKGLFGHVLVVGGELGMGGAVRMASEAALRIGAGLVTVATRGAHVTAVLAARPEAMCFAIEDAEQLAPLLERASVVVVGPGLGQTAWSKAVWQKALTFSGPMLVDADGLNLLARQPIMRDNWVLTPHPGEAKRLLGGEDVQADRYAAAAHISRRYGGVCVLKGAGTVVQGPTGDAAVCYAGNPGMASAGMGDVLSGVIGGLLAQGLAPEDAAEVGVQLHAEAADRAAVRGERGLLATDLFPYFCASECPL